MHTRLLNQVGCLCVAGKDLEAELGGSLLQHDDDEKRMAGEKLEDDVKKATIEACMLLDRTLKSYQRP